MSADSEQQEIVIIGGGPAGVAASSSLQEHGIVSLVIDEQPRPGGQILRQPPSAHRVGAPTRVSPGGLASSSVDSTIETLRCKRDRFEREAGRTWLGGHAVVGLGIDQGLTRLTISDGSAIRHLTAPAVLIAAGCHELPAPLPGWTLPGVLGAGAWQTLIKGQLTLAGERVVFVGSHPLQLLVAAQTISSGGKVAAVVFAQSGQRLVRSLLTHAPLVSRHLPTLLPAASAWRILRRAGVPVLFDVRPVRIEGRDRVTGLQLSNGTTLRCDTVAQCYGFVPQSDLPRQVGVRLRVAGRAGGWAAEVDQWQGTSVAGVFAAGESTGIAGAQAADLSGQLAALGMAVYLRHMAPSRAESLATPLRKRLARLQELAAWLDSLTHLDVDLPAPEPDTLICRCESVSYAQVRSGLDLLKTADALKLLTRCGMGLCQGRMCEPSMLRLLKQHGAQADPGFAARFPARPVPLSCLGRNEVTHRTLL